MEGDAGQPYPDCECGISIHALRMEGDCPLQLHSDKTVAFLSTPSAWRATALAQGNADMAQISIHALRMEGDTVGNRFRNPGE